MRAAQIAETAPTVGMDDSIWSAARELAHGLAGVVVVDLEGRPTGVLAAGDVVAATLPSYVLQAPLVAAALDEGFADDALRRMMDRPVAEVVDPRHLNVVDPDATTVEVATAMADSNCPLVVVTMPDVGWGVVTAARLLDALLMS